MTFLNFSNNLFNDMRVSTIYFLTLFITVQKKFASFYENIFLNVSILKFFFHILWASPDITLIWFPIDPRKTFFGDIYKYFSNSFLLFIWFASLYTTSYINLFHPRICTTFTKMIILSWEKLSNLAHIRSLWPPFFMWDKNYSQILILN